MELLKYVYFCAQKSVIQAGNNKFQDLINAPRTLTLQLDFQLFMSILYQDYVFNTRSHGSHISKTTVGSKTKFL